MAQETTDPTGQTAQGKQRELDVARQKDQIEEDKDGRKAARPELRLIATFCIILAPLGGLGILALLAVSSAEFDRAEIAHPEPWAIFGIGIGWVVAGTIAYLVYRVILRQQFLAAFRLDTLVGRNAITAYGMIPFVGLLALIGANIFLVKSCSKESCSAENLVVVYSLVAIFPVTAAFWLIRIIDYAAVSVRLAGFQRGQYSPAIAPLQAGLVAKETARKVMLDLGDDDLPIDDLLDREISATGVQNILTTLRDHFEEIDGNLFFRYLRDELGDVVALFHPDYLPHISHMALTISQLRALNIPPRRVQLLARRWSSRGLVSEYVVVHDVSDHRPEYDRLFDPEQESRSFTLLDKAGEPTNKGGDPTKRDPFNIKPVDFNRLAWKKRSLKKRAIVTVAPDGTLVEISIEEEIQFNI